MSLSLTLLGTGTPSPLAHRAGPSFLVDLGGEALVFDCGPGSVRRLIEKGVPLTRLSSLFLTHLHYDHCVDYAYLTLTRWDQGIGRIPDLRVCGPAGIERMTRLLFAEDGAFGPDLDARTIHPGSHFVYEARGGVLPRRRPEPAVEEVGHGSVVRGDGWEVRAAEVAHVQPQLGCLAYRLEAGATSIVFSGDTAPTSNLTELATGADVLLHMCHLVNGVVTDPRITCCCSGHLDAAQTARDAGVGTLVLVHFTEQMEQPGTRERLLRDAGQVFGGNIVWGEDLLEVPVGAIQVEAIR